MKSIFVPAGGGETGEAVFMTAFAAAQPFGAHFEFYHAIVDPGEALRWDRHAGLATGPALQDMMHRLRLQSEMRARRRTQPFHRVLQTSQNCR